jgi:hypothetical protein
LDYAGELDCSLSVHLTDIDFDAMACTSAQPAAATPLWFSAAVDGAASTANASVRLPPA